MTTASFQLFSASHILSHLGAGLALRGLAHVTLGYEVTISVTDNNIHLECVILFSHFL